MDMSAHHAARNGNKPLPTPESTFLPSLVNPLGSGQVMRRRIRITRCLKGSRSPAQSKGVCT